MVAAVAERLGPVEIAVANAAAMSMGPFVERGHEEWWRQIEVNLSGSFHVVREVVPAMRRAGAGRIVLISSEWGVRGWPLATGYAASKAGLIAFGKTLGRELAPAGIAVNVIAPGIIDTPQLAVDAGSAGVGLDEIRRRYAATAPIGRIGTPEEIAATVAFLASDRASAFVGQVLQPNGGTTTAEA
jgi:NAD(P)-dependent dehydrogenase (short-subunit alcohol dehydrogenase family)